MLGMRYRGRRKGIEVRAGAVMQARREAGLSLAEVAGSRFSRAAIHLIEHGKVRPSMEALRHIAHRTGKPLAYFASSEAIASLAQVPAQIQALERLTELRDFQGVIAKGLALTQRRWPRRDRALLDFYLGQAFCRLVQTQRAIEHLAPGRRAFEDLGDEGMAVEALDWEATARGMQDDPESLDMAGRALERCRALEPRPAQTEARILGHIAGMHIVRHSWATAVRYHEEAAECAGRLRDLLQLAKMHHGLGVAYKNMGRPAQAREHFDRALQLYAIESDAGSIYRVENDLGALLLKEGLLDAAEAHLKKALAGSEELKMERRGRGFILACLGELHLRRQDYEAARRHLLEALECSAATGERIVQAEAHALLGQVEDRSGRPSEADEEFGIALALLRDLGMDDRLRDCHMEYAEVLERRGDIVRAAAQWKRAAEIGKLAAAGWPSLGLEDGESFSGRQGAAG